MALQPAVLSPGKVPGADWGELYYQRSSSRSIFYTDKKVEEVSATSSGGCSARLLCGKSTAFAVVTGVQDDAAGRALREAGRIAGVAVPLLPKSPFPFERREVPLPLDGETLAAIDGAIRKECPWVRQLSMSCATGTRQYAVARDDGTESVVAALRRLTFGAEVILEHDGRVESGYSSWSQTRPGDDGFSPLDAETVVRRALAEALGNLDAVACPTGTMPVLLSDEAGGTMIHEACGHGMEADLVFEEGSSFAGKIGQRVASENVTIVDDATIPGLYGSYVCDDEGTPAERTVLVENGVLKRYLTDRRCAGLYGLPLTGNGRRQSYATLPMPRMSNTFVVEGTSAQGEMLASVKRGLYVCRMGGGEVNTTTGEFVFDVTQAYLIKDGKITKPVRGASLIGTGIEALKGIRAVGQKLHMEPGMCEKEGQSLPVTDGQPSLLIDGLVIGGTAAD